MNTQTNAFMAKAVKYFKFVPFLSLPITVFFPAGLALYWAIMASLQLALTYSFRSETTKKLMGIPKYLPGTILEKMVNHTNQYKFRTKKTICM